MSREGLLSKLRCPDPHCEGYKVERVGERAVARLCECLSECPSCKGTGFIQVSNEFRAPMKRCYCQDLIRGVQRFNEAGIPARHAYSTRKPDGPGAFVIGKNRGLMTAFTAVARYLKNFRPGEENRGLILCGDVGLGKTHLMTAMIRELIFQHKIGAKFVEFSHLLADLKSGFDKGIGASNLLDPLVQVDVLAIDELGKGRNTEFEGTVLDELVSRRYNAAASILGTTNYLALPATGQQVPNLAVGGDKAKQPTLADRVGPRVYSRLSEMCDFVSLTGDDYRTQGQR